MFSSLSFVYIIKIDDDDDVDANAICDVRCVRNAREEYCIGPFDARARLCDCAATPHMK